jgi:phospholipid-translocating ATPase
MQQQIQTAAGRSGSVGERSDSDEEQPQQHPARPGRTPVNADRNGPALNKLASPLIADSAENSAEQGEGISHPRGGPRRSLRLQNGEFHLSARERQRALDRRSWFQKHCMRPQIDRAHIYGNNEVHSSRYTMLNFLPKNLYEQLAPWNKPVNFYFLCIAALQSIRDISTTNGKPSILLPLSFVLLVTAVKDALEDAARHKLDRRKNEAEYQVDRKRKWQKIKSKELLVGDLVLIKEGQR